MNLWFSEKEWQRIASGLGEAALNAYEDGDEINEKAYRLLYERIVRKIDEGQKNRGLTV